MIIADMDVPFGESTCVSCGTCLQICPTGALMDRASAYMGETEEVTRVKSRCMACSVGCGTEMVVRQNRVIRVEGDWEADPNSGLLCELGRFGLLHERRQRVRTPLVKGSGGMTESSWDEALKKTASALKKAGDKACSVLSGYATNEAGEAVLKSMPGRKAQMDSGSSVSGCDSIACLDEADVFVVVNTDLSVDYQVAGFALKRGVLNRGARVLLLDDDENGLDPWTLHKWSPKQAAKAVAIARDAETPVIICGPAGADVAQSLARQLPKAKMVSFATAGNTMGLAGVGITAAFAPDGASAYYVVAGEAAVVDGALREALARADFVAVQASYREPWDGLADVILPSPTWHEKSGSMVSAQGQTGQVAAAVSTRLPSEVEVIQKVAALL